MSEPDYNDIVYRLRNPTYWFFQIVGPKSGATVHGESDAPREAADEIERLRVDLDAYQKERDEEVVRLRAELAKERERADAHYRVLECVISKRDELREVLREATDKLQPISALVDMTPSGFPDHDICPIRLGMARDLRELRARIDAALNKGETND